MAASITTADHLEAFKKELVKELRTLLEHGYAPTRRRWLKTVEVTRLLELSASTLQTLRRNGTLPFSRIGAVIFYDAEDIDRMLEQRKVIKLELMQNRKTGLKKGFQKKKTVQTRPEHSLPLAA